MVLYELLTGKTPFDAEALLRSGIDEIRRTIRDEEPCNSTKMAAGSPASAVTRRSSGTCELA